MPDSKTSMYHFTVSSSSRCCLFFAFNLPFSSIYLLNCLTFSFASASSVRAFYIAKISADVIFLSFDAKYLCCSLSIGKRQS